MDHETPIHLPVMAGEVLSFFSGTKIKTFFDGTLGLGGHAKLLLEAHPEIEQYIACDRDPSAIGIAKENLKPWAGVVQYVHGNFADLDQFLIEKGIKHINGFFLISECHLCN